MSTRRYRITVTPIESDGHPCIGRSTIEFEQRSKDDWMQRLELLQRQRELSGDECAAFAVGTQLLKDLAALPHPPAASALARMQPELRALIERISSLRSAH